MKFPARGFTSQLQLRNGVSYSMRSSPFVRFDSIAGAASAAPAGEPSSSTRFAGVEALAADGRGLVYCLDCAGTLIQVDADSGVVAASLTLRDGALASRSPAYWWTCGWPVPCHERASGQ